MLAAAILAAGCTKESSIEPIEDLVIGICDSDTKVSLGSENAGKVNLLWSDGDEVSVTGDAGESVFRLKSGAGTIKGIFEYKSGAKGHKIIRDVVYSKSGSTPLIQTYKAGTFDGSAIRLAYHNPAATQSSEIMLKSESSILCFQLTGSDKLTSIKVAFKNGKSYTLSVPSVQLKPTATPFYIVVPEQKADRVDVTFFSGSGSMNRILSSKSFVAGKIHRYKSLAYKADKSFRIMTYNIGQSSKPGTIANITKELKADIAIMNEVKTLNHSTIASGLSWENSFMEAKSGMGNMICYPSKLNKISETSLKLPNIKNDVPYNEDRVCLFVEFEDFILAGSHLETDDFPEHSRRITAKIKSDYAKKGKPVIFCGDMNTRPFSQEMKDFFSEWRPISRLDIATRYNAEQPDNLICIDYIFLWKGGPDVNVTKTEVCKKVSCCTLTDASDHFPVYTDITVGNSSLPLLEDNSSLGSFDIVQETTW